MHFKLGIIIALSGEEEVNGVLNAFDSVKLAAVHYIKNAHKADGINVQCLIACAGNFDAYYQGFQGRLAECMDSFEVDLVDVSFRDYESMAQVRNMAMSYSSGDFITFINGQSQIDKEYFIRLFDADAKASKSMFEDVILGGFNSIEGVAFSRKALDYYGGFNGAVDDDGLELLLRIITDDDRKQECEVNALVLKNQAPTYWIGTDIYPYILGKYSSQMQALGIFDRVVQGYIDEAKKLGIEQWFVDRLYHMMSKDEEFKAVDVATKPVVIYYGDPICFDVLSNFAREFSYELRKCGVNVIMYDMSKEGTTGLARFVGNDYRGVVGFQTALMSVGMKDSKELVNNLIGGPKINFLYDHPLYLYYHFTLPLNEQWVLTQDANYAEYINRFYPEIKGAYHLPPAGIELPNKMKYEKEYGVSFVGSYHDYRERTMAVEMLDEPYKSIAREWIKINKNNPNLSAEDALERVMKSRGELWSNDTFALYMHKCMDANRVVMFYFREKVFEALLNEGIRIDVFGNTWNNCPLRNNPNLVIHDDVGYLEGIEILAKSRISLNVMSWHKAGMTERIANSMLNNTVCLTDKTRYLEEHFTDGVDIVMFDLERIDELPKKVKMLMADEKLQNTIAHNAYENASKAHRWSNRARDFVTLLEAGSFKA